MKKTLGILATSLAMGVGLIGLNQQKPVETLADSTTDITINEKDKNIFDRFATIMHIEESDYYDYLNTFYKEIGTKGASLEFFDNYNDFEEFDTYYENGSFVENYIEQSKMSIFYDVLLANYMMDVIDIAATPNDLVDELRCILDHFVPLKETIISFFDTVTTENIEVGSIDAKSLFEDALFIYNTIKETISETYTIPLAAVYENFGIYLDTYFASTSVLGNEEKQQNINNRILVFADYLTSEELSKIEFSYLYPSEPGFGGTTPKEVLGFDYGECSDWFDGSLVKPEYYDIAVEYAKDSAKAVMHLFTTISYMFNDCPDDFGFEQFFINNTGPVSYKLLDLAEAFMIEDYPNILILAGEVVEDTQNLFNLYKDSVDSRYDAEFNELNESFSTLKTVINGYKEKEPTCSEDLANILAGLDTKKADLVALAEDVEAAYELRGVEKFNDLYKEINELVNSIPSIKDKKLNDYANEQYNFYTTYLFGVKVDYELIEKVYYEDEINYATYKNELSAMSSSLEALLEMIDEDIANLGNLPQFAEMKSLYLEYQVKVETLQEKLEISHYHSIVKDRYNSINSELDELDYLTMVDDTNYTTYMDRIDELSDAAIELGDDLSSYIAEVGEVTELTNFVDLVDALQDKAYLLKQDAKYQHDLTAALTDINTRTSAIVSDINLLKNTYKLDAGNPVEYFEKAEQISVKIDEVDALLDGYIAAFPDIYIFGIIKSVTLGSYRSQIETIEKDIGYQYEIYLLGIIANNIDIVIEETALACRSYEDYDDLVVDLDSCIEYLNDFLEDIDYAVIVYGETDELLEFKSDATEALAEVTETINNYKHGYKVLQALNDLDVKVGILMSAIQDLYLVAFNDYENYDKYLITINKLCVKANEGIADVNSYIETLGTDFRLVDKGTEFLDVLEIADILKGELEHRHTLDTKKNEVLLQYNAILDMSSEVAGNYDLNDSKYAENLATVNKLISDLATLKTKVEGYVEEYDEDEIEAFSDILEKIPFISEELEGLKADIDLFHKETVDTNDVATRYNELLAKYDSINAVYKLDDANCSDYLTKAQEIHDAIIEIRTDILKYKDETGIDNFLDNYNDLLRDLDADCNAMMEDISRRHYDNEVNVIIAESSSFEARVEEISEKFKTNGLNFNGDIEECEGIAGEIEALIAKIDGRQDINSDERIVNLRAKLVELQTQVNSTQKEVEKDHTLLIIIIVVCSVVFVLGILALLYFFGFKKRFLRKEAK